MNSTKNAMIALKATFRKIILALVVVLSINTAVAQLKTGDSATVKNRKILFHGSRQR